MWNPLRRKNCRCPRCRIIAAHLVELNELDDALVRDDDNDTPGSGEVIWSNPMFPLLHMQIWLDNYGK